MLKNQCGRSMIEMIGVLAIIGVLSVGGLEMMTKSRKSSQTAELLGGVANMANNLLQNRKYAAEINSGYGGNCAKFLKQIGKLPAGLTYDSATGVAKTKIGASVAAQSDSDGYFTISVSGLDKETCIKAASNAWGSKNTNRFSGVSVGSGDSANTMTIADAAAACNSASNTINLKYRF